MSEITGPLLPADVSIKRDDSDHPKFEGEGAAHVRARIGYKTPLGDSEHAEQMPYEEIVPGVKFSVWKNEKGREDGALIAIQAPETIKTQSEVDEKRKCATPVQMVKDDVDTREIPYVGYNGVVFGLFVVNGRTFVYKFIHVSNAENQRMIKLKGGDTMCWIASRCSQARATINEHTIPAWTEDTFRIIQEGTQYDTLPKDFWIVYHQLLSGNETNELITAV